MAKFKVQNIVPAAAKCTGPAEGTPAPETPKRFEHRRSLPLATTVIGAPLLAVRSYARTCKKRRDSLGLHGRHVSVPQHLRHGSLRLGVDVQARKQGLRAGWW